jgi:Ion channel
VKRDKAPGKSHSVWKDRCFFLMLSLLGWVLIYQHAWKHLVVMMILFSITMVAGIYAVSGSKRHVITALSIGAFELIFLLAALTNFTLFFAFLSAATLAVFFGFTLICVLSYIVRGQKVTRDKMFGAVCVYLLIGFFWAPLYRMVYLVDHSSFLGAGITGAGEYMRFDFVYYSFETICTLGFGDIQPVSGLARSITILEALTGVLYVAVLISRLVSLYIMHSSEE